ncbi:MAG: hypothetical protein IJX88_05225 [Clostridia bacterium]|nr:hypothetical protein [Clostridia bacterium]
MIGLIGCIKLCIETQKIKRFLKKNPNCLYAGNVRHVDENGNYRTPKTIFHKEMALQKYRRYINKLSTLYDAEAYPLLFSNYPIKSEGENEKQMTKIEKNTAKEILQMLHDLGGCDATDDWDKGYDAAIDTAIEAISARYGVELE